MADMDKEPRGGGMAEWINECVSFLDLSILEWAYNFCG